jgi:hypothetical protein
MADNLPDLRIHHDDFLHDHDDSSNNLLARSTRIMEGRKMGKEFGFGYGYPQKTLR